MFHCKALLESLCPNLNKEIVLDVNISKLRTFGVGESRNRLTFSLHPLSSSSCYSPPPLFFFSKPNKKNFKQLSFEKLSESCVQTAHQVMRVVSEPNLIDHERGWLSFQLFHNCLSHGCHGKHSDHGSICSMIRYKGMSWACLPVRSAAT